MKKTAARMSLELDPTPDILAELGQKKGDRLLIGFAAETENLVEEARRKLESKNCDMVVANLVGQEGTGFESDENEVVLVLRTGETIPLARAPKREIADRIFDQVLKLRLALHAAAMTQRRTPPVPGVLSGSGSQDALPPRSADRPRAANRARSPKSCPSRYPSADCLARSRAGRRHAAQDQRRYRRLQALPPARGAQQDRLRLRQRAGADWCSWAKARAPMKTRKGLPFVGRAGQLLTQMIEGTAKKEGIPLQRDGRLHLQRGEVPAAGESHAAARRDGDLRPVPVPPAAGDPAESHLRAGLHRGESAARHQRRRHAAARKLAQVARHPGDGHLSSVLSAAPL